MFEKMLICLDGSALAEQILPYAVEEAVHFKSKVVLLQVISPSSALPVLEAEQETSWRENVRVTDEFKGEERKAQDYLTEAAKSFQEKGLEVQLVTLEGSPGETILDYAEKNGVGLIAMATHGRGGLGRAMFGSVTDFVLREANLPILLKRCEPC